MTHAASAAGSTCWTVIRNAAAGDVRDREEFARIYGPVVRKYLIARWARNQLASAIDDASQEVFVDCFRDGGALARVDPSRPGGFRAFFYGVIRNVALRFERDAATNREVQPDIASDLDAMDADEPGLSAQFDRAWALSILGQAVERHERTAHERGEDAVRRVELLRLRFQEDKPIREIARMWQMDPARVHKEYARGREEYRDALLDVVSFHHPGTPGEVEREAERLLSLLR